MTRLRILVEVLHRLTRAPDRPQSTRARLLCVAQLTLRNALVRGPQSDEARKGASFSADDRRSAATSEERQTASRLLAVPRYGLGVKTPYDRLAAEIVAMAAEDQRMRKEAMRDRTKWDPEIDRRNTARMRAIVAEVGWPAWSNVGEEAEHLAWLLVQHADAARDFQRQCLELMRDAARGEVCARHIAYLEDRLRVADGRPQLYGTQLHRDAQGKLELGVLEDPEHLDERRRNVGLEPIVDYLASAATLYPQSAGGTFRVRPAQPNDASAIARVHHRQPRATGLQGRHPLGPRIERTRAAFL